MNIQERFNQFQSNDGCNCSSCLRYRFEEDLLERVKPNLTDEDYEDLRGYLNWYFNALGTAEMDLEGYKR